MNDTNNRNLILAVLLSAAILAGWQYFIAAPAMKKQQEQQALRDKNNKKPATAAAATPTGVPAASITPGLHMPRAQALAVGGTRVRIDTPSVDGSLLLKGARFDDLRLKNYRETIDPKSPEIVLLSPMGTDYPYFVETGWSNAPGMNQPLPNETTGWRL